MILSVWEETMRSKEKSDLDWFIFSGIEMELEEVKEERDLLIKLLEENHIPLPEKIRKRKEKEEELPFK